MYEIPHIHERLNFHRLQIDALINRLDDLDKRVQELREENKELKQRLNKQSDPFINDRLNDY